MPNQRMQPTARAGMRACLRAHGCDPRRLGGKIDNENISITEKRYESPFGVLEKDG